MYLSLYIYIYIYIHTYIERDRDTYLSALSARQRAGASPLGRSLRHHLAVAVVVAVAVTMIDIKPRQRSLNRQKLVSKPRERSPNPHKRSPNPQKRYVTLYTRGDLNIIRLAEIAFAACYFQNIHYINCCLLLLLFV